MNRELEMFKLVLEKAEEPEIKLPASDGSWKKQESSRKTSISALLTVPKPLTVWITINCGEFWDRWEYQTTWPASWETYMQVRKQLLELDMEQKTWFQIGTGVHHVCILSPCFIYHVSRNIKWYSSRNSKNISQKIKNRINVWSNNPTSRYISKLIEIRTLKIYWDYHFHCSTIHNSQKMEKT